GQERRDPAFGNRPQHGGRRGTDCPQRADDGFHTYRQYGARANRSCRAGGDPANSNPTETRMARLAVHADAYLPPIPTSFTSGGVATRRAHDPFAKTACYCVTLVETVGVGQSEGTVANMVATFVFPTLARTADQLQGI